MKAIIVDDEAVAAGALKRRIKWEKHGVAEVFLAASMRQAIELMSDNEIDLMLCDVEMPGGSGLELYEWVRTYKPDVECIFVSCHPEYEYVRKALTMGSMDYVLKPVDYEEMDIILENAVKRINSRSSAGNSIGKSKLADHKITVESSGTSEGNVKSDAVKDAIEYIRENLKENISINEIADVAHLNPQYFMRLFKKEVGKPVLEYITDCRLTLVKKLLQETNMSITEVALESGYDNFSYFSKLFRKYEGCTPSEYRKRI